MIKILLLSITALLLFSACNNTKENDKVFWVGAYEMHPKYDKEQGGQLIGSDSLVYIGQYSNKYSILQKYKGPIKGSIVSLWSIARLPNGFPDENKICGKAEKHPENYLDKNYDFISEQYWKKRKKRKECVKKLMAKTEKETIYRYYYARSKPSHKIIYPPRSPRHSNWQVTVYNGRIGDLQPVALTEEQKKHLSLFRKHKCYKYGNAKRGYECYDLPGSDSSIYYTIRENLYKKAPKEKGVYSSSWEGLDDVRYSKPQKWTEIKGIQLNKEQYDYLKKVCKKGEAYCNLNNYKGELTKAQKAYVESVKHNYDK
jgi:hypothetical protein